MIDGPSVPAVPTEPGNKFGTACYGRVGSSGFHQRCAATPRWQTTQAGGANPINACGRHLRWLIAFRTVPGESITVTQLEAS